MDNSALVASFLPDSGDDDTFWFCEILDRSARTGGNNRRRVLRIFSFDSAPSLRSAMPAIRALCDASGARGYVRLSPRSRRAVGKKMLELTAAMAIEESWRTAPCLYARACGRTNIGKRRLWLYDVDDVAAPEYHALSDSLAEGGSLVSEIPSRSGVHLIARPHDPRQDPPLGHIALHKDNPTNLYIPGEP